MDQFGLSQDSLSKLRRVFADFPEIERVIIYGSRAKGTFQPFSDVDITLVGCDLKKEIVSALIFEIDDLLLPYLFDVSIYSKISNPDVIEHIERVGKVVYSKESRQEKRLLN